MPALKNNNQSIVEATILAEKLKSLGPETGKSIKIISDRTKDPVSSLDPSSLHSLFKNISLITEKDKVSARLSLTLLADMMSNVAPENSIWVSRLVQRQSAVEPVPLQEKLLFTSMVTDAMKDDQRFVKSALQTINMSHLDFVGARLADNIFHLILQKKKEVTKRMPEGTPQQRITERVSKEVEDSVHKLMAVPVDSRLFDIKKDPQHPLLFSSPLMVNLTGEKIEVFSCAYLEKLMDHSRISTIPYMFEDRMNMQLAAWNIKQINDAFEEQKVEPKRKEAFLQRLAYNTDPRLFKDEHEAMNSLWLIANAKVAKSTEVMESALDLVVQLRHRQREGEPLSVRFIAYHTTSILKYTQDPQKIKDILIDIASSPDPEKKVIEIKEKAETLAKSVRS